MNQSGGLPFNVTQFSIFVTNTKNFTSNFESLDTTLKDEGKVKDVRKAKVDKDDPYFASLIAAYVLSQKGGVSLEHLEENPKIPKIISIARFYVCYHIQRFLRDRTKLSRFVTQNDLKVIKKNIPTQTFWETKYHHGKEIIKYWLDN